ncbi:site-specific integrase [Mycobacteroides chelonae]|uniref:tyrosine-type recombinase/integrase n=1 Tax=Mycobacteroides chelonae TaxID=1774 RepID=UPI001C2C3970|nr:site-specific integrase [Mycobacteroides chelonae]MBV0917259.1 site-specific integrase [Mycobacteroides chelonae]
MPKKSYHGKGHCRAYPVNGGERWEFIIRVHKDPAHPELGKKPYRKGGFLTEKDADDARAKAIRDATRGLRLGSKVPTLEQFSQQWLESLDLAASTINGYRRQLHVHVLPRIGDMALDSITTTTLNTLYKQLGSELPLNAPTEGRWALREPLGANSINKISTTLGAVFDAAIDDKHILDNPAKGRGVRKPSKQKVVSEAPEMTVWTQEQVDRFLRWLKDTRKDPDYPLWQLYAASGARRSELLALRWSDLNLKTGMVNVRRTLDVERPGHTKKPKNGRSRSFKVSASTITTLKEWRQLLAARDINLVRGDAWVFPMPNEWERHRNPNSTSEMFTFRVGKAQDDLGLQALPTIHLHELRHTAATLLLENGMDAQKVAARLGHESVKVTLDIYAHVTDKSEDRAADILDFG